MNRPSHPPSIEARELAAALIAAALLLFAAAALYAWFAALRPAPEEPEEPFVSEFIVEDRVETDEPEPPASVATPLDETTPSDQPAHETPPNDAPSEPLAEDEPQPEPEPTPPLEVVVVPPDETRRQSVDQPTTNQEVPETEDYFLSEVDNRAEEQTIAENATTEYQDVAAVDSRAQESESTDTPATPTPSRDPDESAASEPSEAVSTADDDGDGDPSIGDPEAVAREVQELEARRRQEAQQQAESVGAEQREQTTSPFEQSDRGAVRVSPDSQSAEEYARASSLGEQVRRAQERSEHDGRGGDSVTRDGVVHADRAYDELFGERTATLREESERRARRESLLGDHEGDWQRTREAMENYDVAVTAGTETMLNTRRDDHARFINAFHAKIHDPWWRVLDLLDRRYSTRESISNRELTVRLEIRVLADGKVSRVRIISTSGNTFFDAEAIRVNYDVGTTPAPRADILCDDGSVYLHWTFSRMPGRCGTHGASVHCPRGR